MSTGAGRVAFATSDQSNFIEMSWTELIWAAKSNYLVIKGFSFGICTINIAINLFTLIWLK